MFAADSSRDESRGAQSARVVSLSVNTVPCVSCRGELLEGQNEMSAEIHVRKVAESAWERLAEMGEAIRQGAVLYLAVSGEGVSRRTLHGGRWRSICHLSETPSLGTSNLTGWLHRHNWSPPESAGPPRLQWGPWVASTTRDLGILLSCQVQN